LFAFLVLKGLVIARERGIDAGDNAFDGHLELRTLIHHCAEEDCFFDLVDRVQPPTVDAQAKQTYRDLVRDTASSLLFERQMRLAVDLKGAIVVCVYHHSSHSNNCSNFLLFARNERPERRRCIVASQADCQCCVSEGAKFCSIGMVSFIIIIIVVVVVVVVVVDRCVLTDRRKLTLSTILSRFWRANNVALAKKQKIFVISFSSRFSLLL
jgi:hypothetical protein